ncbi:MAG: DUF1549 domain-containing protein [Planctomycetaceae bacterium]|nr:DUF1549 domain-containing protein [Planctomycetaceae bacterium]
MPRSVAYCLLSVGFCCLFSTTGRGDDGTAFFEAKIRPVLVEHCYSCHSAEAEAIKGGLSLDTRMGIQQGGESGPAVVPGKVAESLIVDALRYDTFEMPPKQRLPQEVVDDFVKWIEMGAPDPREGAAPKVAQQSIDLDEARKFWAYQPPRRHMVEKDDSTWPTSELDWFIHQRRSAAGLEPSPPADRTTLIRRLSYDLTGLPPAPGEVAAFVADESEDAIEQLVDRLLASPQFGEHWGRHWLDLARYADSNGGDINLTYHNAWRYRNYVIDAFNNDKPFDQFIREQLAGDLLPAESDEQRAEQMIGSGYLVIGPKMLSERDKEKLRMDVVDEQLDSIGKTFLGLALGCARCHDHKFDPIPTADYYALAGILRSTVIVEGIRMGNVNVSGWAERPLPMDAEQEAAHSAYETALATVEQELKQAKYELSKSRKEGGLSPENLLGVVVDDTAATLNGFWKNSSLSPSFIGAGYIHDDKADKGQKSVTFTPDLPQTGEYEVRISYTANKGRDRAVPVTIRHAAGESVVNVDQEQKPELGGVFHVLGRFQFAAGTTGSVTISNAETTDHVIVDAAQFVPVELLKETPTAITKPTPDNAVATATAELETRVKELEGRHDELKKSAPAPTPMAMAAEDRLEIENCQICIRGEPHNLGPAVPRGFLQVTSPETARPDELQGSGRLELAHWVASRENPLTARVTVNRIWSRLFGAGIVRSVDNFGQLGERPTHPELLDTLAVDFMDEDWSVKRLIRKLVLSSTYQQSSQFDSTAKTVDPENRLHWRHNRRRLTAEELRDSLLTVAGELDRTPGESPVEGYGESAVANNSGEDTGDRKER